MVGSDYQTIVEYVKANHAADDASTYDDSEYYYGASSYRSNFDLRVGPRTDYGIPGFEGLTEDEAKQILWDQLIKED